VKGDRSKLRMDLPSTAPTGMVTWLLSCMQQFRHEHASRAAGRHEMVVYTCPQGWRAQVWWTHTRTCSGHLEDMSGRK